MSGGFNLGNAYGAVIIDVSGVSSAMRQAQGMISDGLSGIGGAFSGLGDQMSKLGGAITTFSAPLLAAGGVGLKAAADFDTLMKQIEIFGNVAPDQLDTVRQFALKMGADTKFSSADAAEALLGLLKAGQSVDEAMKSLPEVLNLAAAGNLSLASASGIVSSALAIFKLKATDAGRVSDALARAANASQAEVSDLGQGLSNVGPIAAQFGLSIEDTSAVLGVFSNNGIKGAEAGTQLKSMLLNMSRPTDRVQEAFKALNTSLYDSQGNTRDFNTVLKELDAALDKLPVQQQNELMQDLAGSYGITGLNALRASGGIDNMLASMAAAPSAAKVAEEFMKTFKGNVESLTGSFETLMINGLTPFLNDVLTPMVKQITTVVNSISDWTLKNPELTKQITKVLAVVAVLGPSLLIAGKAFKSISEIIAVVTGPFGLIGAVIAGLVFAIKNNFLGLGDLFAPIIGAFERFFVAITSGVPLGQALSETLRDLLPPGVIAGITQGFADIATFVTETALPALISFANWFLTEALPAVVSFVQTTVIPGIQTLFTFLGNAWGVVGPVLGQIANWFLTEALPAVVNFIQNTVVPGVQKFIEILVKVWNDVSPFLTNLANWFITDVLPVIVHYIADVVVPGIQTFIDVLVGIWNLVQPELQKLYDWFITVGLPFINDALDHVVKDFIKPMVDILAGIWVAVGPMLGQFKDWFVTNGLPAIQNFIKGAMDNFINPFINLLKGLWNSVKPGVEGVYNWFRDTFSKVGTFIQPIIDLINSIIDKAKQALDWLRQLGGGAPTQTSAQIVQGGLPANMQNQFPVRDMGGPGMAGMAYQIGNRQLKNEVYVPGADGQFVSGFVDLMKQVAAGVGGGGQGGDTINVMMPERALANPGAARAIGQDFGRGIQDEMRARGLKPGR